VNKQYIRDITVITEEESGKMSQMRRALGSGYVQGTGFFLVGTFFLCTHRNIRKWTYIIIPNVFIFIIFTLE